MNRLLNLLLNLRGMMLIASFGALLASLLMFLQGVYYLIEAWHILINVKEIAQTPVTVPVLEAMDSFLFGVVLVIFAYGIAVGFVFRLSEARLRRLPKWMKFEGVGQLKEILSQTVIVVLIVIFARVVVESRGNYDWNLLALPGAILLIALALRLLELGEEHRHRHGIGSEHRDDPVAAPKPPAGAHE